MPMVVYCTDIIQKALLNRRRESYKSEREAQQHE